MHQGRGGSITKEREREGRGEGGEKKEGRKGGRGEELFYGYPTQPGRTSQFRSIKSSEKKFSLLLHIVFLYKKRSSGVSIIQSLNYKHKRYCFIIYFGLTCNIIIKHLFIMSKRIF